MGRLDGQVVFITGVARGQGRSHAVRLAEEGADIIGVDICSDIATVPYGVATKADLDETVRLVEATGRRIHAEPADVRDLAGLEAAVAAGLSRFGRLDAVVANACTVNGVGSAWLLTEEQWNDQIEIGLTGTWKTLKATIPGCCIRIPVGPLS
ncbi:MAG TPA: SDR family NAD(P)-dependent oxidoreductase [Amycolatopsis sp.]|nr:SDR family NAD(P)-dependent oxidoreductase [Amycolatopsis sp.]